MSLQRLCAFCGTPFYVTTKNRAQRFCSNKCVNDAQVVPPEQRFWKYVQRDDSTDDCWLWTGAVDSGGYGVLTKRHGSVVSAHRLAYEIQIGPIPANMMVLHTCDTPLCMRKEHLFLGTNADNSIDMVKKGRHQHGITHWKARLSEDDVRKIRHLYASGNFTQQNIADMFHVRQDHVSDIILKKRWKHID